MKHLLVFLVLFLSISNSQATKMAVLKYDGQGDWYANPTSLSNLIKFSNRFIKTQIELPPETVYVGSKDLYKYPYIHATGHGRIFFSEEQAKNLREYLLGGGFLHVDDNYGMDKFVRLEIQKVFPNQSLIELPLSHPIFKQTFDFSKTGVPKIHKHDDKSPQAFGIIINGRLLFLYTYESDLGDGWEDAEVHNDPEALREKALQFGANILEYIFKN